MFVLGELVEVVVREGCLGRAHHLLVELIAELVSARHKPQVLHVILVARIDDRVVLVVSVDDLIVGLVVVRLGEELDEALTLTELACVSGAVSVAMHTEARSEESALARVVHLEGQVLSVEVCVGGLGAGPAVWLEGLFGRMVDFEPVAHVSLRLKFEGQTLDLVADDRVFLSEAEVSGSVDQVSKHFYFL